jgi:hypothetical protein
VRDDHVLLRRAEQRRRRKNREEIQFEPAPVHFANAGDTRAKRHALHVPRNLVAKSELKFGRDVALDRDLVRAALECSVAPKPCAAENRFGVHRGVTVRRPILAAKRPVLRRQPD